MPRHPFAPGVIERATRRRRPSRSLLLFGLTLAIALIAASGPLAALIWN